MASATSNEDDATAFVEDYDVTAVADDDVPAVAADDITADSADASCEHIVPLSSSQADAVHRIKMEIASLQSAS